MRPVELQYRLTKLAIALETNPHPSRYHTVQELQRVMDLLRPSNGPEKSVPVGIDMYLAEIAGRVGIPYAAEHELFARALFDDVSKRWGGSGVINELKDKYPGFDL